MSEARKVKVIYRRWTIIIPIVMISSGLALMYIFWATNAMLALFGGMLAFIGVLTFGILLVMIVSLELSTRSLKRQRPTPPALSEELNEIDPKENEA